MQVQTAHELDIPGWLALAAEVEPLFGPMVHDPAFYRALARNIGRGTAFCIREGDGRPGARLLGAVLFSPAPPRYTIGWLAVAQRARRQGVGRRLVEHIIELVQPPAELVVTTFGAENATGKPARQFYEQLQFRPAEAAPDGPAGASRQILRRLV